jgi:hypothetical protein
MTSRRWWIGAVLCVALCVGVVPAVAQIGRGALAGDVSDQAGSPVPGVSVSITFTATGAAREATTDAAGSYVVHGLTPGVYRVRVELTGFRPTVREGVRVITGETVRIDVRLELGVAEAVTVTADAPLLRSDTSASVRPSTSARLPSCR